jgi:aquaporin Z
MDIRKITENRTADDQRAFACEFLGTLLLVFFAVGAAALSA